MQSEPCTEAKERKPESPFEFLTGESVGDVGHSWTAVAFKIDTESMLSPNSFANSFGKVPLAQCVSMTERPVVGSCDRNRSSTHARCCHVFRSSSVRRASML